MKAYESMTLTRVRRGRRGHEKKNQGNEDEIQVFY